MSPATWDRLGPDERTAAVADLLAAGQAPSIIAFRLKAPKPAIQRMAAVIRQTRDEPDSEADASGDFERVTPASVLPDLTGGDIDAGSLSRPAESQAKASEDNGRTSAAIGDPMTGEASRQRQRRRDGGERPAPNSEKRGGVRAAEDAAGKATKPDYAAPPLSGGPSLSEKPATSSRPVPEAAPPPAVSGNLPDVPDPSIPWSALSARQKQAAVLALRAKGLSANQIQARLQATSRSAVLGVVNRLKAAGHLPPAAGRSKASKLSRPPTPKRAASQGIIAISRASAFDPIPDVEPVSMLGLTATTCRWPVSGVEPIASLFCGAVCEAEHSYCGSHRALSYSPRSAAA